MTKKIISTILILFLISAMSSVFAAPKQTKALSADDENYVWYEFNAKQFGRSLKIFAFKTETQRNNRVKQILNKNGWGIGPQETITEYFNVGNFEKTVLFDEELKPIMKKEGYTYALTIRKNTTKDSTTTHLYTFMYDKDSDVLYVQHSSK